MLEKTSHSSRIGHYLVAAAGFTHGLAKSTRLDAEADATAATLENQHAFLARLAEAGRSAYNVEIGRVA